MAEDRSRSGAWWVWTCLAVFGLVWFAGLVASIAHGGPALGYDFKATIWNPAHEILGGRSVYPTRFGTAVPHTVTVNPPLLPVISIPLRLLPYPVALGLFDAVGFVAFGLALWIAGVRDWRIYCLACCSAPVASGLLFGQVTGVVALGYALAWRYRDRARVVGGVIGLLVALKLLAWPLVIWLALTRRIRAAVLAAAVSLALTLFAWAAIGFQGLSSFPKLLRLSANSWAATSYSIKALALSTGLSGSTSQWLGFAIGGCLCGWAMVTAIQGHDLAAFAAAAAAGIYLSPVVHLHYAIWLLILVALAQPHAKWMWLLVACYWVSPTEPPRSSWQLMAELVISVALVAFAIAPRQPQPRREADPVLTVPPERSLGLTPL